MKKLLLLFIILPFVSCTTIQITEKWAFKEGKYDYNRYSNYIQNSNYSAEDKAYFSKVLTDIVKTDKTEITSDEDFTLKRNFFKPNDSIQLEYFEFIPKNYTKTGLFFLGNGSNILRVKKELEELARKSSIKMYVLNYRGYGKSDGSPSFKTQFKDNANFFNFITEKDHQKPKVVIGYSLGTIAASYLAEENNLEQLYLIAPFSDAEETIAFLKKNQTRGVKAVLRPFFKFTIDEHLLKISNIEKIKNYLGKLTILHAKDDDVLPYEMGKELYDLSISKNKELITIETGNHGAAFQPENWKKVVERVR